MPNKAILCLLRRLPNAVIWGAALCMLCTYQRGARPLGLSHASCAAPTPFPCLLPGAVAIWAYDEDQHAFQQDGHY